MTDLDTFPVMHCAACRRDVVVGRDLDAADAWILVCTRCATALGRPGDEKRHSATSLGLLGYAVDGAGSGCGTGGCGSCGSARAA